MNRSSLTKGYDGTLLYSGGLDSYVAYYYLTKAKNLKIIPVYFCLGNSYEWFEENHILHMREFNILVDSCLRIGDLENKETFHVPMRNVLLLILGAIRFHHNIFIGSLYDDNAPDGNEKVFKAVTKLLTQVEHESNKIIPFNISAPLREDGLRKAQVCRWFVQNIGSAERLTRNTVSCFNPINQIMHDRDIIPVTLRDGEYESPHCYSCAACFRRNASLFDVGVNLPFYNKEMIQSYKEKFESKHYDIVRSQVSLKYITWLEQNEYV